MVKNHKSVANYQSITVLKHISNQRNLLSIKINTSQRLAIAKRVVLDKFTGIRDFNLDKAIASSILNPYKAQKYCNMLPSKDTWAKEYQITKNYQSQGNQAKGGDE